MWGRNSPAHPRSRGENGVVSPPLPIFERLIPAHAGKTRQKRYHTRPRQAHPRSRGENGGVNSASEPLEGSSPLTRGKRTRSITRSLTTRLIPAHAGKTQRWPPTTRSRAAHPRSRGENVDDLGFVLGRRGSSPLTRGKRPLRNTHRHRRRLIPAHAGKTINEDQKEPNNAAHPRSRGENEPEHKEEEDMQGSSPLTRGKRRGVPGGSGAARLIPAHAGKT